MQSFIDANDDLESFRFYHVWLSFQLFLPALFDISSILKWKLSKDRQEGTRKKNQHLIDSLNQVLLQLQLHPPFIYLCFSIELKLLRHTNCQSAMVCKLSSNQIVKSIELVFDFGLVTATHRNQRGRIKNQKRNTYLHFDNHFN